MHCFKASFDIKIVAKRTHAPMAAGVLCVPNAHRYSMSSTFNLSYSISLQITSNFNSPKPKFAVLLISQIQFSEVSTGFPYGNSSFYNVSTGFPYGNSSFHNVSPGFPYGNSSFHNVSTGFPNGNSSFHNVSTGFSYQKWPLNVSLAWTPGDNLDHWKEKVNGFRIQASKSRVWLNDLLALTNLLTWYINMLKINFLCREKYSIKTNALYYDARCSFSL